MVRDTQDESLIKVSVYLKSGVAYLNKDVPPLPQGQSENIISFWEGDALEVYPLNVVDHFEYTFTE